MMKLLDSIIWKLAERSLRRVPGTPEGGKFVSIIVPEGCKIKLALEDPPQSLDDFPLVQERKRIDAEGKRRTRRSWVHDW